MGKLPHHPLIGWDLGDIHVAWGYGLLIGGVVLPVVAFALAVREHRHPRVHKRQS